MDRLEHVDEGVRVTDLKTGKSGHSAKTVPDNPQLAAYQMALLASGKQVAGARIALLGGDNEDFRVRSPWRGRRWRSGGARYARSLPLRAAPISRRPPRRMRRRYCSFDRLCPARERGRKVVE